MRCVLWLRHQKSVVALFFLFLSFFNQLFIFRFISLHEMCVLGDLFELFGNFKANPPPILPPVPASAYLPIKVVVFYNKKVEIAQLWQHNRGNYTSNKLSKKKKKKRMYSLYSY